MISKNFVDNLFSIKDKVAVVTGASGALGSAVAAGYGLAGAKVILTARNEAKLLQIVDEMKASGCECAFIAADPTDEDGVRKFVKFAVDTYGEINILCACHGYNAAKSVLDQSLAEWQRIMDANTKSAYLLSKYVGEQMVKQNKGGKLVITSSARSKMGMNYKTYWGDIDTSQLGLMNFTFSAVVELNQRFEAAQAKFTELFPDNDNIFKGDGIVTGNFEAQTGFDLASAVFASNPDIKYWFITSALEQYSQGAARAAESLGIGQNVLAICVGSDVLPNEWDNNYEGCWVACVGISNYQYTAPAI